MATVVNNPGTTSDSGIGVGMMFGILLLVIVVFLFLYFGFSMFRGGNSTGVQVPQVPEQNQPLTVPDEFKGQIDINVNQPK